MVNLDPTRQVSRRELVAAAAVASASAAAGYAGIVPDADTGNPIRVENKLPGAQDWQLSRIRIGESSHYRSSSIEGYCSAASVQAGDTLRVMVSVNPPCPFTLDIFRMGYYDGRGARLMKRVGPLTGVTQPDPPAGERGLRECKWEPSLEFTVPEEWLSGVYLGRLTRQDDTRPWQSWIVFIVRDERPADVLFQCSDNTWQAYNLWPATSSLYTAPGGALVDEVDVSFDRPYAMYSQIFEVPHALGAGEFLLWEYPLCYWLEQQGYDVAYCSNSDMVTPDRGLRCKAFISVGHDEYWDLRQYESVKKMIDSGVSALFLCGNSVCFVSPYRDSSDGRPHRIIHRAGTYGGMSEVERAQMGPFSVTGPDERQLMGARTIIPFNGGGDWIVAKPDHWVFEGTGLKKGDRIPGLVGWEFHGEPADIPGLEIVAEGIALQGGDHPAHWTATVHPGPKGNVVFNAATIWWAQGLSSPPGHVLPWSHFTRPHGTDERVQRITRNVLHRALSR